MKRPRDYSDMHEPWEDEPIVDETYFGSPELPIMRPIIIHLLIIAFVIAILGWYFWPVKARADASIGIIDVAADLPVVHVLAVTGIVVLLALGTIQIVDAAMFGMSAVARVIVAAVMFVAAATKFDPALGVRFNTYAALWIRASMTDYIVRNWSVVRGGTSSAQKALFFNVRRMRAKLEQRQITGEAANRVIGETIGVSPRDVDQMTNRLSRGDVALDKPVSYEDGDGVKLVDSFVSPEPLPDQVVEAQIDGERLTGKLHRAVAKLPDRERDIIRRRFLDDAGDTLETIGDRYGISKERVRQLEHRALARLRHSIGAV